MKTKGLLSLIKHCRICGLEKPIDDFPLVTTKSKYATGASWTYARPDCDACTKKLAADKFQRRKHAWKARIIDYYKRHYDDERFRRARSSAKQRGATEFMSREEWNELRRATTCHWCGIKLHPSFTHIDHVVSIKRGGQHTASNVVMACANCNERREWECKLKHLDNNGRPLLEETP